MSVTLLNTENGKVSCETREGTTVHININQRSALDCLLDTIRTLKSKGKSAPDTKPTNNTASGVRLGVGVSLISLGCISVMLAILLCVVQPSLIIMYNGTHFWVGFPFIICGALNVMSYRYPKRCWEALAFIGVLVSLGVSIAGMVCAIKDLTWVNWDNSFLYLCDRLFYGKDGYNYGYGTTRPPRNYYESDWGLSRCKMGFQQYQNLLKGLVIMTLLMMIWGLCISLISLGYKLKALCCGRTCKKPIENKDNSLLPQTPTGEVFIA